MVRHWRSRSTLHYGRFTLMLRLSIVWDLCLWIAVAPDSWLVTAWMIRRRNTWPFCDKFWNKKWSPISTALCCIYGRASVVEQFGLSRWGQMALSLCTIHNQSIVYYRMLAIRFACSVYFCPPTWSLVFFVYIALPCHERPFFRGIQSVPTSWCLLLLLLFLLGCSS